MPAYTIRDEYSRQRVADTLSAVDPTLGWRVTVEKLKKVRTLNQNSLYHRHCAILANEIGEGHEDMHELLKVKFLPPRTVTVAGETIEYRPSTTQLTTAEFSAYMEKYTAWAASFLGVALPYPEDDMAR